MTHSRIVNDTQVVSLDEIRKNDYNLNIRRYADTSPPPEHFDVKAILRGGIPVVKLKMVHSKL